MDQPLRFRRNSRATNDAVANGADERRFSRSTGASYAGRGKTRDAMGLQSATNNLFAAISAKSVRNVQVHSRPPRSARHGVVAKPKSAAKARLSDVEFLGTPVSFCAGMLSHSVGESQ